MIYMWTTALTVTSYLTQKVLKVWKCPMEAVYKEITTSGPNDGICPSVYIIKHLYQISFMYTDITVISKWQ